MVALLLFDFSSVAVENGGHTTFNGLFSIYMLIHYAEVARAIPGVFWMGLISLIVIVIVVLILTFVALYSMYKKHWMLVTYNILVQLLFIGAIAFIAPFVIAEDRAYLANRDAVVNIYIYAPQIVLWAVALIGCFMATVMSYGHKALITFAYLISGMGILIMPILAIMSSGRREERVQQ